MKKIISIIAGEPNSISSEIIFKAWLKRKRFKHKPFFVIGNIDLLKKQQKKLKFNLKIREIKKKFILNNLKGNQLPVLNIKYKQKKAFQKPSGSSSKYIFKCFEAALDLVKEKKILGFINCPISKKYLLKNKYQGITEYLSKKTNSTGNEVMMIFNTNFSVSPITTHISVRKIHKNLKKSVICKKVKVIDHFYKYFFNIKPKIGVLGLNPHNYSGNKISEEKNIIIPSIKYLKRKKINIFGPIPADSSLIYQKKYKLNVIVGMFHDQILAPFKFLYGFNSINITLGLPFIRISPDHGIGEDIIGKKVADPTSLINSIKFFNRIN